MRDFATAICTLCVLSCAALGSVRSENEVPVRISPRDARYFELSDGTPFIPIGLNVAALGAQDDESGLRVMEEYLRRLSQNGGNHARVWLSSPFWDVEHERAGEYDEAKAQRIDRLLAMARKHGIRLKLTFEHFREIDPDSGFRQTWALKSLHHVSRGGAATSMDDWLIGDPSRRQFEKKLDWFAARYADDAFVFGWELWNEINAVRSNQYLDWTGHMLAQLGERFPDRLVMQSLGSFDRTESRGPYRAMCLLAGNEIAQVHRYLDLGAQLEICHGPVDVLSADAVRELIAMRPARPILLAEGGAVEPNHTGPFQLYAQDRDGIILHDVLFAPFFAGAAGTGQIWHWDHYVQRNDLWWHFARFAAVVEGLDPPAEHFEPMMVDHPQLRVYALRGERTLLLWCRDVENTWRSELADQTPPATLSDVVVELGTLGAIHDGPARVYDPWHDRWTETSVTSGTLRFPPFRRSIVARIER